MQMLHLFLFKFGFFLTDPDDIFSTRSYCAILNSTNSSSLFIINEINLTCMLLQVLDFALLPA